MAGRGSETGRLARLGFSDVETAARNWLEVGSPDDEELLTNLSAAADPDQALAQLTRLLGAAPDAEELKKVITERPAVGRSIALVLGASAALGDHLNRHPEDWHELADPDLDGVRPSAAGITQSLCQATDRDQLRRGYRRLLLRLAARDLSLELRVEDAAAELADLASGAI